VIKIYVKNYGMMSFVLDRKAAPNTCANFVELVKSNYYTGLTFHRIIKGFMIQGGDNKKGGPGYSIRGEFLSNGFANPLKHDRGVISMARTSIKDSASAQFFIMHKPAQHLDGEYSAFGKIVEGLDVLDKIASVRTSFSDAPYEDVIIDHIEAIDEEDKKVEKL